MCDNHAWQRKGLVTLSDTASNPYWGWLGLTCETKPYICGSQFQNCVYNIEAYATVIYFQTEQYSCMVVLLWLEEEEQTRKHRLREVLTSSVWLWYMTIYIKISGGFGKNKFNSIHLLCQNDLAA